MLDDDRIRSFRLRVVPGVHLLVDGRQGFGFVDELLGFGVPGFGVEQLYYSSASRRNVRLQCFPGFREYRALITSWMMLLLLSGESAISSLAAAIRIHVAG